MINSEHMIRAASVVAARRMAERAKVLGVQVTSADAVDSQDMSVDHIEDNVPPLAFHLVYENDSGDISERVVLVRQIEMIVSPVGVAIDYRISGICQMRHAKRMFKASNIIEMVDLSTGEVSSDAIAYFGDNPFLRPFINITKRNDVEKRAINKCRYELTILLFIAASDGYISDVEMDEIVKHVFYRTDEDMDEDYIRRYISNMAPDAGAFVKAVRAVADIGSPRNRLVKSMHRLVSADGVIRENEFLFVAHVEKFFDEFDSEQWQWLLTAADPEGYDDGYAVSA